MYEGAIDEDRFDQAQVTRGVRRRQRSAQLIILSIGCVLSAVLCYFVRDWEQAIIEAEFRLLASTQVAALEKEIDRHLDVVRFLQPYLETDRPFSFSQFRSYTTDAWAAHGDIVMLAWAPRVPAHQADEFVADARRNYVADFGLSRRDLGPDRRESPAEQDLFPLYYVEPFAVHSGKIGQDLMRNTALGPVLERAREREEFSISARVQIKDGSHSGVYIVAPVFREISEADRPNGRRDRLQGFIVELVDLSGVVAESVERNPIEGIHLHILDQDAEENQRQLYQPANGAISNPTSIRGATPILPKPRAIAWDVLFEVAGREWLLRFTAGPKFLETHPIWRAWAVLALGIALTAVFAVYLQGAMRRAEKLAEVAHELSSLNLELEAQMAKNRQAFDALEKNKQSLAEAQRIAHLGSWEWDIVKGAIAWSEEVYRIFGLDPVEGGITYESFLTSVHPDDRIAVKEAIEAAIVDDTVCAVGHRIVLPDGMQRVVYTHGEVYRDESGAALRMIGSVQDVTERVQRETQMFKFSSALDQAADGIMITNAFGVIEYVNSSFEAMTGFSAKELLNRTPSVLKSGRHEQAFYAELWKTIKQGGVFEGIIENKRKDGSIYYEEKTITPLKNPLGEITHFISTGKDISDRMRAEERLHHLAYHDALTNLPNRALFMDRLAHALERRLDGGHYVAVFFLDLDNFKKINDSLGHEIGDRLLQAVPARLQHAVRKGDTVARFGGDEFAVLFEDAASIDALGVIAAKIIETFSRPIVIDTSELYISTSIGIAVYPQDSADVQTLIKHADTAMYRAKEDGKNSYRFYSAEMSVQALERLSMETGLRHALEKNQFFLQYQPQVAVATGAVIGFEALVRWNHPVVGVVSPLDFIPVLEDTGLIVPVGDWIFEHACGALRNLQSRSETPIFMAVNFSGKQFRDVGLFGRVREIMDKTGVDPEMIEIEITESILMQNDEVSLQNLDLLSRLGIRLSVDDFGTGYSSLSYLKRFPVDTLKIDRSFVRDIILDKGDAAIVSAIVSMAHSLDLFVVAEGVESNEQLQYLEQRGCDAIQGYLFSEPLSLRDVESLLGEGRMLSRRMSG